MPGNPNDRRRALILALISVAAAIPRLVLGVLTRIEYDGYWHVFIAQQDKWPHFWADIYDNAHPPLFFLLLKAVLFVTHSHSVLAYRSISIATGVASVYLVGQIAWKITASNIRAYQAALAYGLASPGIVIADEVRSYMLSAFFVLLSFGCLIELLENPRPAKEMRLRIEFAAWTILGCLSHYYAFFYAGAAILLLIARRRVRWMAETATCAPIIAAVAALYFSHAQNLAVIQPHLARYYFDPMGKESVGAFLLRNWENLIALFSPFTISSDAVAIILLLVALACAVWLARTSTMRMTALLVGMFAAAGVAGKYPFGGDLRQQYLLFPFLVLCGALLVERTATALSRLVADRGRMTANALLIVAIVSISAVWYEQTPKRAENVIHEQAEIFDRLVPKPKAVFLDQYNLILFFVYHHMWTWKSIDPPRPIADTDVYRLQRGNEQMLVFRDKTDWNIDATDPAVFRRLADAMRGENIPEISVFSARQSPPRDPYPNVRVARKTLVKDADDAGICVERQSVNAVGWHATFWVSGCLPSDVPPLQVTGTFHNDAAEIDYTGAWMNSPFPAAASGSLTFSNAPGASAKLAFEGSEITWVYARAFNRGIAQVKVDGVSRGEIDLYGPKILWQTRRTFSGLTPGKHTFEVIVTGKKNAAAADKFVDVDELIAK